MVDYLLWAHRLGSRFRRRFGFLRTALVIIGLLHYHLLPAQEVLAQMAHRRWTAQEGAPASIKALAQAADGTLWIATEGGLFNFDGLSFRRFESPVGEPALPSSGVESVLISRDGAVWVGMWQVGAARIANGHVTLYSRADNKPMSVVEYLQQTPDGTIWGLEQDRHLIRFGCDGRWHFEPGPVDESHINNFFIDSKNTLWVEQAGKLYRRDLSQNGPYTLTTTAIDYLFGAQEAPDGTLWFSDVITAVDRGRTQHVDREGHVIAAFDDEIEAPRLLYAPDGSLWMGTFMLGLRRAAIDSAVLASPSRIRPPNRYL